MFGVDEDDGGDVDKEDEELDEDVDDVGVEVDDEVRTLFVVVVLEL